MNLASIPSPTTAVWHLGPIPIRAYALCIVVGIIVACVVTEIRMRRRGAPRYAVVDIAVWAVPFGIVGARIYHVLTSWGDYFGANGDPVKALKIWEGGLGIWGAVAGGALGAWIACRHLRIPLTFVADALAPGLPLAQAIGRLGNWFNNELYGRQTTLPWGLKVHVMDSAAGRAETDVAGNTLTRLGTYHPTFLYELLWNVVIVAPLVFLLDRRFKLGKGRAFALYAMAYTAGRAWIEALRVDQSFIVGGLRLNIWTSLVVFLAALAYFILVRGPQEFLVREGDQLRVVTAEQYVAYQRGELASAPEGGAAADGASGGGAAQVAATDGEPAADGQTTADSQIGADGPQTAVTSQSAAADPVAADGQSVADTDAPSAVRAETADAPAPESAMSTPTSPAVDPVQARSGEDR